MEIKEAVALSNIEDIASDDKCPFCGKPIHEYELEPSKITTNVIYNPKALKCEPLKKEARYRYTTASHHLISANQCYVKLRRLVRMGSMVGYDINNPNNGIGLPTTARNIKYEQFDNKQYGDLGEDKRTVAFGIMEDTSTQWHVGHHEVQILDEWGDESDNSTAGHKTSYDTEIIKKLLKLLSSWSKSEESCKENKQKGLIEDMNNLSQTIRNALNEFPESTAPYYVSQLAYLYYKENRSPAEPDAKT